LTDFSVTQPSRFLQVGSAVPSFVSETVDVKFYSVTYRTERQPRMLALKDSFVGNARLSDIAILKRGIGARLGALSDTLGPDLPVRPDDVDWEVSFPNLVRSQVGSSQVADVYLLKKWPQFSRLLSAWEAGNFNNPLPAIGGGGLPIRPFLGANGSLYFIYDQYGSIREIRRPRAGSNETVIVLVQRLDRETLDDVCYLVLAPSKLAATAGSRNAGN
jgi:hypothetical protein